MKTSGTETFTVILEDAKDGSGDLVMPIPDQVMAALDAEVGDDLDLHDNGDGTFTISKVSTEYVLVETVLQYRMRYVVEVPKGKSEWASDTVVMGEAKEFSQLFLGEQITSDRIVTPEEIIALCNKDNHHFENWTDFQKFNTFVTPISKD